MGRRISGMTKSVIIVDDHPIVLAGLAELIDSKPEYSVVATGSSADDILNLFKRHPVDLMVLDLHMPGDVKKAIRSLAREPNAPYVLVFTAAECAEECLSVIEAGAHGYAVKGSSASELYQAMSSVLRGNEYISGVLAAKVLRLMRQKKELEAERDKITLTVREEQIVEQLLKGASNRSIAEHLNLSENTIKFYMSQIMQKFDAQNRLEVVLAMKSSQIK